MCSIIRDFDGFFYASLMRRDEAVQNKGIYIYIYRDGSGTLRMEMPIWCMIYYLSTKACM